MTVQVHLDAITTEVISHTLTAYTDEMALTLERAAYSPMVRDVRDYCAAIVDLGGRTLGYNTGGLPTHYSDIGEHILDGIEIYSGDGFEPGDAVMMNHAYTCGQHANNVEIYTPIFFDRQLVAFAATRAHWQDIGGITANRPTYATTDAIQEGLQVRSVKVFRAGEPIEDVLRLIRYNLRQPDVSLGDLRAQIAACRVGERRFCELLEKYSLDTVHAAIETVWDQSEALARAAVEEIPDGVYEAESFLDDDGYHPDRIVPIHVRIEVSGPEMTIDLSGMADQVTGPINSRTQVPALIAFKALTTPDRAPDVGCFRPVTVVVPEGKLINAVPPAAMGSWSWPFPTIIDTFFRALADVVPRQVAAGNCGMPYGAGFFYGQHPTIGRPFVSLSLLPVGWGGRPNDDGVTSGGMILGYVRDCPVEVTETFYPLLVERLMVRPDSGGAGRFRGGLGIECVFHCEAEMFNNAEIGRTKCPPWGLFEGKPGAVSENILQHPDGSEEVIRSGSINRLLPSGTRLTVRTGGGGGYGDPRLREPERVLEDVLAGYVSRDAAEAEYRVALTHDGDGIDWDHTRRLRGHDG